MKRHEIERERRRQLRLERFDTEAPRCAACPETDVRCLEAHHVAGRRYDALTVALCANCHKKVTDDQKDHPPLIPKGDPFLQQVGHFLLGLADMLRLIVDRLVAFGEALIERVRADAAQAEAVRP